MAFPLHRVDRRRSRHRETGVLMANVKRFEVLRWGRGAPARLAKSRGIVDQLEPVAERVLEVARSDPNRTYTGAVYKRVDRKRSDRLYTRVDRKRSDRARWIITLPPYLEKLARRVEAKRGTMRRAAKGA
jgi:hypothetical protein